ncbi:MAG TPA: hypothetical protein VL358_04950 [Caulobacteraceae bacterium]|jgi:hypothetical protein|nr:hypothetical protein [Caulobacteraceae bacterium]
MITREDITPLSAAIGSAAVVGLTLGLWLSLPPYLSQPIIKTDPEIVSQIDPNLARYDQMIAANGVRTTPYILAAGYAAPSQPQQKIADADEPETATFAVPVLDDAAPMSSEAPTRIQVAAWTPAPSRPPPAGEAPDDWDHLPTVGWPAQGAAGDQTSPDAALRR